MKYAFWIYRNGAFLVEKYVGRLGKKEIIENDNDLLQYVNPDETDILCLTDISQASLVDISYPELIELFESIELHLDKISGMKVALYNGSNAIEDFLKASAYSKYDERFKLVIKCFMDLDEALNWLDITSGEEVEVKMRLLDDLC